MSEERPNPPSSLRSPALPSFCSRKWKRRRETLQNATAPPDLFPASPLEAHSPACPHGGSTGAPNSVLAPKFQSAGPRKGGIRRPPEGRPSRARPRCTAVAFLFLGRPGSSRSVWGHGRESQLTHRGRAPRPPLLRVWTPPCSCPCAGKRNPQVLGAQHGPTHPPFRCFLVQPSPGEPSPRWVLEVPPWEAGPPGPCGVRSVTPSSCVPSRYRAFRVSPNRRRRPHFNCPRKMVQAPGHQGTSGRACSLLAISEQATLKLARPTSRPTDSLVQPTAVLQHPKQRWSGMTGLALQVRPHT